MINWNATSGARAIRVVAKVLIGLLMGLGGWIFLKLIAASAGGGL